MNGSTVSTTSHWDKGWEGETIKDKGEKLNQTLWVWVEFLKVVVVAYSERRSITIASVTAVVAEAVVVAAVLRQQRWWTQTLFYCWTISPSQLIFWENDSDIVLDQFLVLNFWVLVIVFIVEDWGWNLEGMKIKPTLIFNQ